MADVSLLQIEEILYPTLEVRTNGSYNPQGEQGGTLVKFGRKVEKVQGRPGKYGLIVSMASDNEKSRNATYSFVIDAYALVSLGGAPIEGEEATMTFLMQNGMPLVMGALRERLADVTARMPYGRFLINAVPLPQALQINQM